MEKVAYAQAASQGAPQAIQVGDRFPIVQNLTEATQLLLARCQAEIVAASKADESERYDQPKQIILIEEWRPPEPAHVEKVRLTRRAGRSARYQQVVQLPEQGMAAKEIACRLDLSPRTVQRWLTAGTFPEAKKGRVAGRVPLTHLRASVLKRWEEGERTGMTLWREIQDQGYTGTQRSVYRYLETRHSGRSESYGLCVSSSEVFCHHGCLAGMSRDPETLEDIEREDLGAFCQVSPTLLKAYRLIQEFLSMVHKREGQRLDTWREQIAKSDLPELQRFAHGVELDKAAVKAGLTWPINNGMVEVSVALALESVYHYGDNWRSFRQALEALRGCLKSQINQLLERLQKCTLSTFPTGS